MAGASTMRRVMRWSMPKNASTASRVLCSAQALA
jgi:hypothetical protein